MFAKINAWIKLYASMVSSLGGFDGHAEEIQGSCDGIRKL